MRGKNQAIRNREKGENFHKVGDIKSLSEPGDDLEIFILEKRHTTSRESIKAEWKLQEGKHWPVNSHRIWEIGKREEKVREKHPAALKIGKLQVLKIELEVGRERATERGEKNNSTVMISYSKFHGLIFQLFSSETIWQIPVWSHAILPGTKVVKYFFTEIKLARLSHSLPRVKAFL